MTECNKNAMVLVHSTESFGSVDGPGVRFIVFLQGCPLRCQFCHNPDTWKMTEENGAVWRSADELLNQVLRYRTYWKNSGGITVSGGEPLLQIDFMLEFFKKAKEKGIHTVIDTAGGPFTREEPFFSKFQELMKYTDLLLVDIKHIDTECHKTLTGRSNENILDMIRYLSDIKKPIWIRHVLVPERSDKDEYLTRLADFIHSLDNVEKVEILPYHTLGVHKYEAMEQEYKLKDVKENTPEQLEKAAEVFKEYFTTVVVN